MGEALQKNNSLQELEYVTNTLTDTVIYCTVGLRVPDVTTLRSPLLRLTKISGCPRHMASLLGVNHNATVLHVYSTYYGITNRRS